jgi:hypothetical protein
LLTAHRAFVVDRELVPGAAHHHRGLAGRRQAHGVVVAAHALRGIHQHDRVADHHQAGHLVGRGAAVDRQFLLRVGGRGAGSSGFLRSLQVGLP